MSLNTPPLTPRKRIAKWLSYTVLGAIIAGAVTWGVRLGLDWWKRRIQSSSYVAIMMSRKDPTFTIPEEFLKGFGTKGPITTKNGAVISIRLKEDCYSIIEAERLAKELIKDKNCVLLVGGSNSQLTEVALNEILASEDRPGFILPIATATNLTSIAQSANFRAMLRMVPDNENQANEIKNFIASRAAGNQRVAILVDEDNRTYSEDLANRLSAKIRKNGGEIIYKKSYGNNSRLVTDLDTFRTQGTAPEFIIFVGVSNNGLLLIDELKALQIKSKIIFTDGCTVEELMNKSKVLNSETYFLSAVTITDGQLKATYEPIGVDAFQLVEQILRGMNGSSRADLRRHIEESKFSILLNGQAGNYEFDSEGNNKKMSFRIYHIDRDKLTLVKPY
jgi:ABC-type branched-subunit amino acid transport system substrate-binding protein